MKQRRRAPARALLWACATATALSWAASPAAALCPQNLQLQIGDRTVDFEYETDVVAFATWFRVVFGLTPGDTSFQSRLYRANSSTRASRFVGLTGLAPATTYYIDPQVSDVNQVNWSDAASCEAQLCPSAGPQAGGYECEDAGGGELRPKLTTLALDAPAQRLPQPPTHDFDPHVIPAVNGSTFTVSVDAEGLCTDFQAQLNACAAANTSLVHEIVVPPGAICRPESEGRLGYETPAKFGSGTCIVRSGADPLLLPPAGVRSDPAFRAHMARIETNRDTPGLINEELLTAPNCGSPPCTEGWRFENIVFQHPPHLELSRRRLEIVSVDTATGVITVAGPHGYKFSEPVQVNAPGIQDRELHRSCRVSSSPGVDTFRCIGKEGGLSGAYAGGGFITDAVSVPLAGCTPGAPVVCSTTEPHGFGNFHSFALASIANGVLTTAVPHSLQTGTAVLVEGTNGGTWDGIYEIAGALGSTGTLVGAPGGTCSPCTGTVRQLGLVNISGVLGDDEAALNKTHLVTILDGTTFRLEQSQANGSLTGGAVSYDPPLAMTTFRFAESRRIVFDRCLVDLRGVPYRNGAVFNWITGNETFRTSSAMINSWVREDNSWFGVNPLSRIAADTGLTVFSTLGFVHQIYRTRDLRLENNMFESNAGILVFADINPRNPEDLSVVRNVFWTPERLISGRAEARGRYYLSRHHLELKAGKRAAIRGNYFRGNAANGTPVGAPVLLSLSNVLTTDGERTLRDIAIEHNTFHQNGGFVDLGGSTAPTSDTRSSQRLQVTNNLATEIDAVRFRTFPAGQSGNQANGWPMTIGPFMGRVMLTFLETEDLQVKRNTVLPALGHGPYIWLASAEPSGGTLVEDNILPFSRSTIFQYGLRGDTNNTNYLPGPASGFGYDFWKVHYRQGPGVPDPLAVWDNVVVPCTDFAEDLDRRAALLRLNSMASFANQHFACTGGCPANFANQVVASDGLHCVDREQELFGSSVDYKLPTGSPYSGYGADLDALRSAQGRVYDIAVSPTANSATIDYLAPDAATCFVDVGTDKLFSTPSHARISDGGGVVQRSVLVPGLSALTTYHFRVLCQSDQPRGVFLTQPGGPI